MQPSACQPYPFGFGCISGKCDARRGFYSSIIRFGGGFFGSDSVGGGGRFYASGLYGGGDGFGGAQDAQDSKSREN